MAEIFRPRRFSMLLDEAVELSRRPSYRTLVIVAIVLATVTTLYSTVMATTLGGLASATDGLLAIVGIGGLALLVPIMLVAQAVGYCVLAASATRRVFGQDESLGESLRAVFRPAVLVTLILVAILSFGSLLALILPFFFVSALLSFVFPVMLIEQRYGTDAISRSCSLAWRNPRGLFRSAPLIQVMATHAVFFGISTLLSLAIQLPYQIANAVMSFRQALGGEAADPTAVLGLLWLQVPVSALATVASTFAAYYLFHTLALLFRDVRETREATSIAQAIEQWEKAAALPSTP